MYTKINYTCRNCKTKYDTGTRIGIGDVSKLGVSYLFSEIGNKGYVEIFGHKINSVEVHFCEDGSIGISDITSVELVDGI